MAVTKILIYKLLIIAICICSRCGWGLHQVWAGPTHPEVDKTTMIPRVRVLFTQQVSLEVFLESLESLNVTQLAHKDLTSLLMSTHLPLYRYWYWYWYWFWCWCWCWFQSSTPIPKQSFFQSVL